MVRVDPLNNVVASAGFMLAALLAAAFVLRPIAPAPTDDPEARLRAIMPEADPFLLHRVAENWGDTGVRAAERHGEDGLMVLEAFEDEAAYCLEHQPEAFAALSQVVKLDPTRFRLAAGPWNRAVLDWAQSGRLLRFVERLRALTPDQLAAAEESPDALPLLCVSNAPIARAMLDKYGDRAWRLFMAVNFAEHPEDLERVAAAVEEEGDLILRLNESFGLHCALLLVPPSTKQASRHFPEVVRHALRTLEDEPTALALMIVNYDEIKELLESGKSVEQIEEAIDLFGSLPPVVRQLALDHKNTVRLLTETWHGQKVGAEVIRRCGPAAADLIYDRYASDDRLKWPALVAFARLGESAYQVFHRYRDYGKFHTLLRRSEPDLMNPRENPPVIAHAIHNIYRHGQEQVDIYAEVRNLKGQVLSDVHGPLPEEAYLEWVPGYIVYRTAANYADGRHVTGGDVFWASVDAVSTATLLYGPVVNGLKTVGDKLGQETVTLAAKEGISEAERALAQEVIRGAEEKLGQSMEKLALQTLKRESTELVRFGEQAGKIATGRLKARTEGLALELADRRQQYLKLAQAGDINGKARLIEDIGDEGARKYAAYVGYDPILESRPGRGMGFDHVYRDGSRIKVVEAKGGSSPLKPYRGHDEQGTIEYTRKVAEWALKSPSSSAQEKKAAEEVLKAAQEGRLEVEVVRTEHVQGKPESTRVEKIVGTNGLVTLPLEEARTALLQTPGMASAWLRHASKTSASLDLSSWLKQGQVVAGRSNIALWAEGSGPLAPREAVRKGVRISIPVGTQSVAADSGQVSNFAFALMEGGI